MSAFLVKIALGILERWAIPAAESEFSNLADDMLGYFRNKVATPALRSAAAAHNAISKL